MIRRIRMAFRLAAVPKLAASIRGILAGPDPIRTKDDSRSRRVGSPSAGPKVFTVAVAILVTGLAGVAGGCASHRVERPDPTTLTLGQSRYDDVTARLGTPTHTGQITIQFGERSLPISAVSYREGSVIDDPKRQRLYFYQGVLVGETWEAPVDPAVETARVARIKALAPGVSTRASVLAELGRPDGRLIPPMVREPSSGEAWEYSFGARAGADLHGYIIRFDDRGVVIEVDRVLSGGPVTR